MVLGKIKPNIEFWMTAERFLGVGTRTYSSFSADTDINQEYHPLLGKPSFTVKTKQLKAEEGIVYKQSFGQSLQNLYFDQDTFILPIHPEIYGDVSQPFMTKLMTAPDGPSLKVVPTATARTVLVTAVGNQNVEPHFIKLHYPKRISRFVRRLRHRIIKLQLWVSNELYLNDINHLPEVGAGVVGRHPVESWGFIIRSATPLKSPEFETLTMPLFALYGGDHHRPDDPPLILQLIDKSGLNPADWFERHIAKPLAKLWCEGALKSGLLLELHGQNCLIQIAPDSTRSQLVYRDCDVYVDNTWRKRGSRSKSYPEISVIGRGVKTNRKQLISLIYDGYLGHHLLQFLASQISQNYGVSLMRLQRLMMKHFRRYGHELLSDLPSTEYYYADRLFDDNDWRLVNTHIKPRWRPTT